MAVAGCAQQIPPTGGPKDVKPPVLLSASPPDGAVNFSGKQIELHFDEYIAIENLNQQLLITPALEGGFTYKPIPKGLRLNFNEHFRPNTTYSLNFRNALRDVTERNPVRNLKLVFSTGPAIDSLGATGTVLDALTLQPVFDALVGLYPLTDTLTFNRVKPYYLTKTDSTGGYQLENLAPGRYRLAAFTDGNNNLLFDQAREKIGFLTEPFDLQQARGPDEVLVSLLDQTPNRTLPLRTTALSVTIPFARGLEKLDVHFERPADSLAYALISPRELRFYRREGLTDTVRAILVATDSLGRTISQQQGIRFRERGRRDNNTAAEATQLSTSPRPGEAIGNPVQLVLNFSKPIAVFQRTSFKIEEDTARTPSLPDSAFRWNRYRTELTVSALLRFRQLIRTTWAKGTFISVEGDTLAAGLQINPVLNPENVGTISGQVSGGRGGVIVELLDENDKPFRRLVNQRQFVFRNVPPGRFGLRVIDDRNGNGRWDGGDVTAFRQPEPVKYWPELFKLVANFDLTGYNFQLD